MSPSLPSSTRSGWCSTRSLRSTSPPPPSSSSTTRTGGSASTASIPSSQATSSSTKSQRSSTSRRPSATTGTCARPSSRRSRPPWPRAARGTRRCRSASCRSKSTAPNDISDEYLSFMQEKTIIKDHFLMTGSVLCLSRLTRPILALMLERISSAASF